MLRNGPKNILLVGGESAGLQTLKLLADSPHHIAGVMATPAGDDRHAELWNAAGKRGIERIPADRIRLPEFAAEICERQVDVLLNVHSLYMIPGAVLDACRIGAFNLHPGPLPEYAGLDVPGWALFHGETSHGVTLHEMVPEVDAGTIAYQSRFDIGPSDTGLTVMSRCVRQGMRLIESLLTDLYHDPSGIPRIPQDLTRRRVFFRRPPEGGRLDWNRPARAIVNHIRAADYSPFPSPWGHPRCVDGERTIGVIQAAVTDLPASARPGTVGDITATGVLVASGDLWVNVRLVEIAGNKRKACDELQPNTQLTLPSEPKSALQPEPLTPAGRDAHR